MNLRKISLALLTMLATYISDAQTVTLVAGNLGGFGYGGDTGPATDVACKMKYPRVISHDAAGNLYFIDYMNCAIRKISTAGIITTIAGTGHPHTSIIPNPMNVPATSVDLAQELRGLAVDAAGNVYFAEGAYIRQVNTSGFYSNYAGNGGVGQGGDGGLATDAEVDIAVALAFDPEGNLALSSWTYNTVRKINKLTGIITKVAGWNTSSDPGDGGPATAANLGFVRDIDYDAAGNLYILSGGSGAVRKVNTMGIISTIAGDPYVTAHGYSGDGGAAIGAKFNEPKEMAFDNEGNLYISDENNKRIRRITPWGQILTYAGTGSSAFNGNGLAATETNIHIGEGLDVIGGYLYFAEEQNQLIRRINIAAAGINELAETADIQVYPMPCGETFTIASELFSEPVLVAFTDVTGKVVQVAEISSNGNAKQYSTRGMAPGMYFARVVSASTTYTLRLIKE